jgi:hypothetical protein
MMNFIKVFGTAQHLLEPLQSLRQIQERWSATVEGSVGLRTLNERINQIEPLARSAHIWLTGYSPYDIIALYVIVFGVSFSSRR